MASTAPDRLRDELLELIRERERDGIRGLADRVGPAEWADLIPQLEPGEVAVLLQWLPDEEIPEIFEELDPSTAANLLRTLSRNEAAEVLGGMRRSRSFQSGCRGMAEPRRARWPAGVAARSELA